MCFYSNYFMCANMFINNRVERSCSHISIALFFDLNNLKQVEKNLRIKRQIYETLISDHN